MPGEGLCPKVCSPGAQRPRGRGDAGQASWDARFLLGPHGCLFCVLGFPTTTLSCFLKITSVYFWLHQVWATACGILGVTCGFWSGGEG